MKLDLTEDTHTRVNILTGDKILVSPHRTKRPWQGKVEPVAKPTKTEYDASCYLCPGNERSVGHSNPNYTSAYSFTNDFSSLLPNTEQISFNENNLLIAEGEKGVCKVVCFSPHHSETLPLMSVEAIRKIIELWQLEFTELSKLEYIKYIQIFENKGEIMGCSNPHPHGQIWATSSIPMEPYKETIKQNEYFERTGRSLLFDYTQLELQKQERIVIETEYFVALVPFWATWPYETMIVSKRQVADITLFSTDEVQDFAVILKALTCKYDNLFSTSFPYSAGIHQAPVNSGNQKGWHWHMHFYPPLLRSAAVKKFMVGFEMLANAQRDITPELAAKTLRELPLEHYLYK